MLELNTPYINYSGIIIAFSGRFNSNLSKNLYDGVSITSKRAHYFQSVSLREDDRSSDISSIKESDKRMYLKNVFEYLY